ncbi:YjcZ family sporulation protein [Chengkuizengella marina]|uniref:YjcZ family sporulation protein n=1 Tax=Chengkuizengella marina TaxID=2507566 RepID=A0A6N9Q034_9BACL|nr:YjcZ family sporulation protein [Chengkuizengella marina]NBI28225.1 YjcZ family sporulation protein [Chengkuizengella marina]
MSGHSGSGAALVLVLFILLVIILVAASGRSRYTTGFAGDTRQPTGCVLL